MFEGRLLIQSSLVHLNHNKKYINMVKESKGKKLTLDQMLTLIVNYSVN